MISPELIRRYPFFGMMDYDQIKEIAMISDEISIDKGKELFIKGKPADYLYILIDGAIDLFDTAVSDHDPRLYKEYLVSENGPGDILSMSALIEPYKLSLTARAAKPSHLVRIDAQHLRKLAKQDPQFGYVLMYQATTLAMKRLDTTRVLLATKMGID
jgi:CRP-like cAMP-binding protein